MPFVRQMLFPRRTFITLYLLVICFIREVYDLHSISCVKDDLLLDEVLGIIYQPVKILQMQSIQSVVKPFTKLILKKMRNNLLRPAIELQLITTLQCSCSYVNVFKFFLYCGQKKQLELLKLLRLNKFFWKTLKNYYYNVFV